MQHVHRVAALDEVYVRVARNILDNVLGSLDLAHGDDTRSSFLDGLTNHVGTLRITLSPDDHRLGFLFLPLHVELGPLGVLLCDLLLLNGGRKLPREAKIRERNIVQNQTEFLRSVL